MLIFFVHMKKIAVLIGFLMATGGWSWGSEPTRNIVCTTAMVADLVKNVVGDRAEVLALMGEGVDPHLYKPTRDDATKLLRADWIFSNGLLLEGRLLDTIEKIAKKGTPTCAVADGIAPQSLLKEGDHPDPHVWMDVQLWRQALRAVLDFCVANDPAGEVTYRENFSRYDQELEALDQRLKQMAGEVPDSRRVLVTAHDAFQYFGRAYGFQVKAIQGISTDSEAGMKDIQQLVAYLQNQRIPAIFVESSVPDKNVRAVMEGVQAGGHQIILGGELYSDSMGAAGTPEGTYLGMMLHNMKTIVDALKP